MKPRLASLLALLLIVSACASGPIEKQVLSDVERDRLSDLRRMLDHPHVLPAEPYSCFPDRNSTVVDAADALDDLSSSIDAALAGAVDFAEVRRHAEYYAGFAVAVDHVSVQETTQCYWQHLTLAIVFGEVLDGSHVVPDEIDESEYSFEPWFD